MDHLCIVECQGVTKRRQNKFVIMKLAPGNSIVNDFVGVADADHSEFLAHLPDSEPRFGFYEVVDNGEKPVRMPVFIFW